MENDIIVIGQNGASIAMGRYIESVEAGETMVFLNMASGKQIFSGRYDSKEECVYAVGLLYAAMGNGEKSFEFPHKRDLQERISVARQHRSKVTMSKASHGGS